MAAIANGLALHGGFIPYGGTFLTFSDYARNALRMAALMKLRSIFVFTHDSIGLGEDGPTHQSIEHAASLRLIPQHRRLAAVRHRRDGGRLDAGARAQRRPDRRCSSRARTSRLPSRDRAQIAAIAPRRLRARGFRRRADAGARRRHRDRLRSAAGARRARGARRGRRRRARRLDAVHAACSTARTPTYRDACCRAGVPRVAVEAGVNRWLAQVRRRRRDPHGGVVGIDRFGESAPAGALFKHFGFTAEHVAARRATNRRRSLRTRSAIAHPPRDGAGRAGDRAHSHRRLAGDVPRAHTRRVSRRHAARPEHRAVGARADGGRERHQRIRRRAATATSSDLPPATCCRNPGTISMPNCRRCICGASSSMPASGGGWWRPSRRAQREHGATG